MKKRLFQILDELNLEDYEKKEGHSVIIGNTMVSADYKQKLGGTQVCMGVAGNVVVDIISGKKIPLLVLIDKEDYKAKENNQSPS